MLQRGIRTVGVGALLAGAALHACAASGASADAWLVSRTTFAQPTPRNVSNAPASRGVERVLLDAELRARRVWLLSIDGGLVTYRDADGLVHSEPVADLVALTTPLDALSVDLMRPPVPRIELVDGLRLPGLRRSDALDDAPGESLLWNAPSLGPVVLGLAEVRRIVLESSAGSEGEGGAGVLTRDRVRLSNGDVIDGFVARIGSEVEIEDATGAARVLAVGLVSEIALANPGEGARGTVAWLAGGSIVRVERIGRSESGDVRLVLPDAESASESSTESGAHEVRVPLPDLHAIVFDARRLIPLATIEARSVRAEGDRRWTPGLVVGDVDRAPLRLGDIEMPGPMSVEWEVPAGASRFATTVTLPRAMRVWGDCVVTFEMIDGSGGVVALDSRRVLGDEPSQRVVLALPAGGAGRVLRVGVLSGERGPIQDRPVLESPVFLVDPGASP